MGLLKTNPKLRPSAETAMSLAWIAANVAPVDLSTVHEVFSNLEFSSKNALLASICAASVARQLDHEDLQTAQRVFCEMDVNGDGVLSMEEVRQGLKRVSGGSSASGEDAGAFFRGLDLDGSGSIEYTEFCAAGVNADVLVRVEALWAAFKTFDLNNDGCVSKAEVEQILKNLGLDSALQAAQWQEVISELGCARESDETGSDALLFQDWVQVATTNLNRSRAGSESTVHENVKPNAPSCTLLTSRGPQRDRNSKSITQACAKFAVKQPTPVA